MLLSHSRQDENAVARFGGNGSLKSTGPAAQLPNKLSSKQSSSIPSTSKNAEQPKTRRALGDITNRVPSNNANNQGSGAGVVKKGLGLQSRSIDVSIVKPVKKATTQPSSQKARAEGKTLTSSTAKITVAPTSTNNNPWGHNLEIEQMHSGSPFLPYDGGFADDLAMISEVFASTRNAKVSSPPLTPLSMDGEMGMGFASTSKKFTKNSKKKTTNYLDMDHGLSFGEDLLDFDLEDIPL